MVAYAFDILVANASIAFLDASPAIVHHIGTRDARAGLCAQTVLFLASTSSGGPVVGWMLQQFGARDAIAVDAVAALGAGVWGLAKARRSTR
ncbi:MAG: hypothetical protein ACLPVY_13590 [Acidimicrobiia bacterium]